MKNLVITAERQRYELRALAICLLLALCFNVYAIVHFATPWSELLSTWKIMLGLGLGFYLVFAFVRFAWHLLRSLFKRRARSATGPTHS